MKLRVLEKEDLKKVHQLFNDKTTMDYWFMEPYASMPTVEDKYLEQNNDHTFRIFAIDVDGMFAGIVGFEDIDTRHRHAEIEIALLNNFMGNGIAQVAFKDAVKYGFETLNLHKIYLSVDTDNDAAVHIYKKNGFKVEGTLKDQYFVSGKYHDVYTMALFEQDWCQDNE